ncbi:ATP-binding protein [Streptomyces sp. NPDC006992]|uniref:sensor histidine kinase n=1 Tax=Streptomyces sp. NPDC006992 TaxID=3155601 RepID=UPI0033DC5A7E
MSEPPSSSIPPLREAPAAAVDAALRRRLVRLTCAPALVVALAATAAVAFLWSAGQPGGAAADAVPRAAAAPAALAAVLLSAAAALVGGLRAAAAQAAALNRRARSAPPAPAPAATTGTGVEDGSGPGQRLRPADQVAVFVNLARRLQSLLHREIHVLDELENQVEDPDILKGVFQVDHLATRIRRYAENLAVLGGAVPRRQWTRPVQLTEILRSAAAEVEHYQRVRLVPPIEGTVSGQAVADVIHLLSELVENATFYSPPQTRVLLRASRVTAGLAVEVEDRGLGMTERTQQRMNALLADPEGVDVGALLADGRIGLYVVGMLARRHGIAVELRGNIYGGVQAVLVLPHAMLGDQRPVAEAPGSAAEHAPTAEQRAPQAPPSGAAPPWSARPGTAPHPRSARPAAVPHPGSAPPDGPGTPQPTTPAPAWLSGLTW